ncbi:MAG: hypothetical protein B6I20_12750 [Bacteroidetes bacterium 4572_117]|nr:MAG: hypothetical protein B6I20_12750 [Bacteroidetes bacterium 4572_117]
MLRYFLSSILILATTFIYAQDNIEKTKGIRFGFDVSPLVVRLFEPERSGLGVSIDFEFKTDYFGVIEGGLLNYGLEQKNFNYQSSGYYGLFGLDYNLLKAEKSVDNNILFAGFRYGISSFQQNIDNIVINNYWGTYNAELGQQQITGSWFELLGGIKAEVFFAKNFFIGWTLRAKTLLSGTKNETMQPIYIPGYGKTDKKFRFGISWFVAYKIPFKQK